MTYPSLQMNLRCPAWCPTTVENYRAGTRDVSMLDGSCSKFVASRAFRKLRVLSAKRMSMALGRSAAMPIVVTPLKEADIPGAIDCIQAAFAEDPYNRWVFSDRSAVSHTDSGSIQFTGPYPVHLTKLRLTLSAQFSPGRNRVSLRIRCLWGIRNALFYVAKDTAAESEAGRARVLGVAMWMPPRKADKARSWDEWTQGWVLWGRQVKMNLWWGRGGLNVKVCWLFLQNMTWNGRRTAARPAVVLTIQSAEILYMEATPSSGSSCVVG